MPKIVFIEQNIEVTVPLGTTLLGAAQLGKAPEGHACGGVCACSTCHVYIEEGAQLLSEAEEEEEDILDKAFDVTSKSRLGCQARVDKEGTVKLRISGESLQAYYNEHPDERS